MSDIEGDIPDLSTQSASSEQAVTSNQATESNQTGQSQQFWQTTPNGEQPVDPMERTFPQHENFRPSGLDCGGVQTQSPLQTQYQNTRSMGEEIDASTSGGPQLPPFQAPDLFSNSPDAGTEISYGSLVDVATARWFGMLATDADFGTISTEGYNVPQAQIPASGQQADTANFWNTSTGRPPWALATGHTTWEVRQGSNQEASRQSVPDYSLWKSPNALTLQDNEQHLFEVFVARISHWIDLFDPLQHFCTLVPRLAMFNIGLLGAILALSIRYLSLNSSVAAENLYERHDALRYYHESLHYVQNAMQYSSYLTSLELLATALIISAYEMLDGSRRDWERHLQGVFGIQRSQVIHGDTGGLRAAVWWAWLQQDVWAAFRDKRKTFTFWRPVKTFGELNPWELAARAVFVMAKVVNYCAEIENSGEENNIQSRIDAADRLHSMLDDWERHLTIEFMPLPRQTNSGDVFKPRWIQPPMFGVAMQMYNAARILLVLHRPSGGGLNGFMRRQKQLDKYAEAICGIAVTLTDYGSSVASSQCLFIAGMCTSDERKRHEILRLIGLCRQRSGWPVKPMDDELKAIWDTSDAG
ncbi:uncharacterized protein PV07_07752 [Cladophialophora immunda]|uniref:Transcription factor domain-containing protein n=1 Tax=Cladophialophora immunda TaxID=569365 RepID=A0A0D2CAJ5_9EURO|nr:uncharacterized protein PV07_07752 [Cladophialophora immunda]KIW28068.1 hypothetical protein PV07_07752 [Cladophialophora immunda]